MCLDASSVIPGAASTLVNTPETIKPKYKCSSGLEFSKMAEKDVDIDKGSVNQ